MEEEEKIIRRQHQRGRQTPQQELERIKRIMGDTDISEAMRENILHDWLSGSLESEIGPSQIWSLAHSEHSRLGTYQEVVLRLSRIAEALLQDSEDEGNGRTAKPLR